MLASSGDGVESILRFGSSGPSLVTQIPPPPASKFAPANPDAIAIGPNGEIGVIRMPSGSEPPSDLDPAWLVLPGPRLLPLAPWSTAVAADDPACAQDTGAYRATIQTIGPWIRSTARPFPDGTITGMTARVRWSPSRVCIEAVEIPESTAYTSTYVASETLIIATFGPNAAGRVSLELGSEARAPLTCSLKP